MSTTPEPLRMIVVDDSALYRQLVRNVLRDIPGIEVVGAAKCGGEALTMAAELDPDLLTLDVQMPDIDGIAVLRELKSRRLRPKAIMLSSFTAAGAQVTTDALFAGAFDFILKPSGPDATANRQALFGELSEKIAAFRQSVPHLSRAARLPSSRPSNTPLAARPTPATMTEPEDSADLPTGRFEAVVIGTSTGGPVALREVLPRLPGDFPAPILIVQHMPPQFTHSLAARLNELSPLEVVEACDGMSLEPGWAYLAPGGRHMKLAPRGGRYVIRLTDDQPENSCRPSVDYLFRSASESFGSRVLAVVLTGMGRDGVEGCREIKRRGGLVITQHPDGCVVYGMPKAVFDENLHDRRLRLERIPAALIAAVRTR